MKIKNFLLALGSISLLVSCKNKEPIKLLTKSEIFHLNGHDGEWKKGNSTVYEYDKKGNCISEKTTYIEDEVEYVLTAQSYSYDENGNKISFDYVSYNYKSEDISCRNGESWEEYDEHGNYHIHKTYGYLAPYEESFVTIVETYDYDELGNKISYDIIQYKTNSTQISSRTSEKWEYNKKFGKCSKHLTYRYSSPFVTPVLSKTETYTFDKNGNEIRFVRSYVGSSDEVTSRTYNKDGLLTTESFSYVYEGTTYPYDKTSYMYYPNTSDVKWKIYYLYDSDFYIQNKEYYEYDNEGSKTLYKKYNGNNLDHTSIFEKTSSVSFKEITIDPNFKSISESTYLDHQSMLKEMTFERTFDEVDRVSNFYEAYDLETSATFPFYKTTEVKTYRDGVCIEEIHEEFNFDAAAKKERSYSSYKIVNTYIDL